MNIAIDARFYGPEHTGLGRYSMNVLKYLPKYLKSHSLQILLRDKYYQDFPSGKNIKKIHAEIPHYSLAEQLKLPGLLSSIKADLLYTFHFNASVFSSLPTVITVHDLIKTHFSGSDTTTRSPLLYRLKRFGYNQVITHALTHASNIIVPSNSVKNDILASFSPLKPERIRPIPEAPDEIFRQKNIVASPKLKLPANYILFVGNAYPHKNLSLLLRAFNQLNAPELHLVIVAKDTPFLTRTLLADPAANVHVLSNLSDQDLVSVYNQARLLVSPSLMEGYGLVGLEALMVGTPVLASNIPVYREVYGDLVTYFDPHSVSELVSVLKTALKTPKTSSRLQYPRTWDDVAKSIAEVLLESCTRL